MSGRVEREGPRDEERRLRWRRREDAGVRDICERLLEQVERNERVLFRHTQWLDELGVESMSDEQRHRLPLVLRTADERRESESLATVRFTNRITLMVAISTFISMAAAMYTALRGGR